MENLIPCQFCDNLINFDDYQNHTTICMNRYHASPINILNNINTSNNAPLANYIDNIINQINHQTTNNNNLNNTSNTSNINISNTNTSNANAIITNRNQDINSIFNQIQASIEPYISNIVHYYPHPVQLDDQDEYEQLRDLEEEIGDVKVGIVDFDKYLTSYKLIIPTECIICKNIYQEEDYFYKTKCSHSFCIKCSNEWFNQSKKCPLCMKDITEIKS